MSENKTESESETILKGDTTVKEELRLVREFLDTDFDSVERDGLRVSETSGCIWVEEAKFITVPKDDTDHSKHHYDLLWRADVDDVRTEIENRLGG